MLDIRFMREHLEAVKEAVSAKREKVDIARFLELEEKRREFIRKIDSLKSEQNKISAGIALLIREKKDASEQIKKTKQIAKEITSLTADFIPIKGEFTSLIRRIPNIPHSSVPRGGVEKNIIVRTPIAPKSPPFALKDHVSLGQYLDIFDFSAASRVSGSHFALFKGDGALLERALINFMLDLHIRKHGYKEVFTPFLANRTSMFGTAQLPKLEEDMYALKDDDFFLIPTAEVTITNMYRDKTIKEDELPLKLTGYSACFRREAGSYGKETKGLLRVHQFDKVEMVKFSRPEDSYDELEKIVEDAQDILESLGVPYRVVLLASGDLSFASAKTYDLEVFSPASGSWLEVSSCSNFESFQSRRANIKYRKKDGGLDFVHTLNGSGLALARLVVAIVENFQTEDGKIRIPDVLKPYMHGKDYIQPE